MRWLDEQQRHCSEVPMELSEDIRREIEKSRDRETILEVVSQLQSDGVVITRDILAAIRATIAVTEGVVE
jgi:predicted transcriptional regulator